MSDVRVVNENFATIGRINWYKAICMWAGGRVEIIEDIEDDLLYFNPKFAKGPLEVYRPKTIKVLKFTYPKNMRRYKRLTKKSLFSRDKGKCGYCGDSLTLSTMTIDHIVPRSKGGDKKWQNVVTCCESCNSRKGDRTVQEANMTLRVKPFLPQINDTFFNGEYFSPSGELVVATSHPKFPL